MQTPTKRRLESLMAGGKSLREIADALGMTGAETAKAFAAAGVAMPMPPSRATTYRTRVTDVPRLIRLWTQTSLSLADVARELRVSRGAVSRAVRYYGLKPRPGDVPDDREISNQESDVSQDTLRLAPSVWAAAEQIRSRWTEADEYNRRCVHVHPVVIPSFEKDRRSR